MLLVARTLHGVAAAGTRVLAVAVVRDRFEGAAMAQVKKSAKVRVRMAKYRNAGKLGLTRRLRAWEWASLNFFLVCHEPRKFKLTHCRQFGLRRVSGRAGRNAKSRLFPKAKDAGSSHNL